MTSPVPSRLSWWRAHKLRTAGLILLMIWMVFVTWQVQRIWQQEKAACNIGQWLFYYAPGQRNDLYWFWPCAMDGRNIRYPKPVQRGPVQQMRILKGLKPEPGQTNPFPHY